MKIEKGFTNWNSYLNVKTKGTFVEWKIGLIFHVGLVWVLLSPVLHYELYL